MSERSLYNLKQMKNNNDNYAKEIIIKDKLRKILKEKNINEIVSKFFIGEISREGLIYYFDKKFKKDYNDNKELINYLLSLYEKEENKIIDKGLVTIIITTYNRKQYLVEAINSILNQTYKNIEIIVMDDCSNDGTQDLFNTIYKNDNIKYYRNKENKGCGFNRLFAFNNFCKGKFVIFMDDDDFYIDNDYIKKAVIIQDSIDGLSFVAADTFIEYSDHLVLNKLNNYGSVSNKEYFINFMKNDYKKPSSTFTALFKKEVLEKVKLNDMKMVNDTSIYLRALLYGDPYFINDIVGVYRIHGQNLTFSCSLKFIIDNLEEKYNVGILAKNTFNLDNIKFEEWLFEQFYITIIYYLDNSSSKLKDKINLLMWVKGKSILSYKRFRNIIIKSDLKQFI